MKVMTLPEFILIRRMEQDAKVWLERIELLWAARRNKNWQGYTWSFRLNCAP